MVRSRSARSLIRDYLITILVAAGAALIIRNFVIEAYRIPTPAMQPTLMVGDTLFVVKWPFQVSRSYQPERGDVVAYSMAFSPESSKMDFIRRIVGLPGDWIEIQKGSIILNGQKLALPLSSSMDSQTTCPTEKLPSGRTFNTCLASPAIQTDRPIRVPANSVFVVGDYRGMHSGWGLIPASALKGKAAWIWLSVEKAKDGSPRLRWERMLKRIE